MRSFVYVLCVSVAGGCSNLLIPAGSTVDGSTIISYSADSATLMGDISHWPSGKHAEGDMREIFCWDTGVHLGAIPEAAETFNVMGNTNEHQLTIGETTFGGLEDLSGTEGRGVCHEKYGCIDYGQLIYVTLQRAKSAREAIKVIDNLMQTYGYASEGESFSIADPSEVWLMEIIGKGKYAKGAVWVAQRVPDGYVGAHANQARIRGFSRDDPDSSQYSADVVDFPRSIGLYNGTDEDFSFSDIFDPVSFSGARFCEARVYSFFSAVAATEENIEQYLDYAQGYNLTNRMPLFVKTNAKLGVNDTMWHMRNHYEGTWFDPSGDVGGQAWNDPHRLGEGLTWTPKGSSTAYVNERPIGTQYAGWNMIGNQRKTEKYSVLWFGPDDSTFSLHAPFYGVASAVPSSWDGGNCTNRVDCKAALGLPGAVGQFSMDSQHWVQNLIANYAYSRYNQIAPVVQARLAAIESRLFTQVAAMDAALRGLDDAEANVAATNFTFMTAENLHEEWKTYFGTLFATFVDGYMAVPDSTNVATGVSKVTPHFSEAWKQRIIADAGDKYRVPASLLANPPGVIDKLSLRGLGGARRQDL